MNWFDNMLPSKIRITGENDKKNVPEGMWAKCARCDAIIYRTELERNQEVCTKCDFHMRIGARRRLESFFDEQGVTEIAANLEAEDVLKFRDDKKYRDRLNQAQVSWHLIAGFQHHDIADHESRDIDFTLAAVTHDLAAEAQ